MGAVFSGLHTQILTLFIEVHNKLSLILAFQPKFNHFKKVNCEDLTDHIIANICINANVSMI